MIRAALSRLVQGLCESLHAPVDPVTFVWFRRCFLSKFLVFELLVLGGTGGTATLRLVRLGVIGASIALTERRRGAWIGFAMILALKLLDIVRTFPYTINHAFFDAALLLLLGLGAREEGGGLHPLRAAQAGILAVFFHAGLQKLAHGYYVDGQFLALELLYDDGDTGRRLRGLLSSVGGLLDLPLPPAHALPRPSFIAEAEVALPGWVWSAVCVLSNGTWIAEAGLPIMALRAPQRGWAVLGLLGLEAVILIFSGEISFGFTVVACLLSFFPRVARWTYPLRFAVLGAFAMALQFTR